MCLGWPLNTSAYVLREFVRHYNAAHPHQTLELDVPEPGTGPPAPATEYERKAA